jgi:hypothetical protein
MIPSSPEDVRLDEEQRDRLRRCLHRAVPRIPEAEFERFVLRVRRAMSAFLTDKQRMYVMTDREVHDTIRDLWNLATDPDPSIGRIRARIREFPEQVMRRLDYRVQEVIPKLYDHGISPSRVIGKRTAMPRADAAALRKGGFRMWAARADDRVLIKAIMVPAPVTGAVIVPGRSRGKGKRSGPRIEPFIDGIARGKVDQMRRGGRPSDVDFKISLIGSLAHAWERTTGTFPSPGRSDRSPFGELVHCVFQWQGIEKGIEHALRWFWKDVPST